MLKRNGVTSVISLLDPDLPYEAVLLAQERELASRYSMQVRNFPMASILGQSFGKDYLANSKAVAQAAFDSAGVTYIHCYLGLHRARHVQKFLETYAATSTSRYAGTPTYEADVLDGWSNYRLGRVGPARTGFTKALSKRPGSADPLGGLGYCALRSGDLDGAARQFTLVLTEHPEDLQAIEGLAHVRYQQGQRPEAKALFTRVLARQPDNADVRSALQKLEGTS